MCATHHETPEFALIVASRVTRTVEIDPAFLALANSEQHLMHVTSRVLADVLYHRLEWSASEAQCEWWRLALIAITAALMFKQPN